MTFDDDFILLHTESGPRHPTCKSIGLTWPPPALINIQGFQWRLFRRSEITDEDRSQMSHVCRGAEYYPITHPTESP